MSEMKDGQKSLSTVLTQEKRLLEIAVEDVCRVIGTIEIYEKTTLRDLRRSLQRELGPEVKEKEKRKKKKVGYK